MEEKTPTTQEPQKTENTPTVSEKEAAFSKEQQIKESLYRSLRNREGAAETHRAIEESREKTLEVGEKVPMSPLPASPNKSLKPPTNSTGPAMPKCGHCGARPVQINTIMAQMSAGPGQPIPIVQFFFCKHCEATLSVQIMGAVPPTIQTPTVGKPGPHLVTP